MKKQICVLCFAATLMGGCTVVREGADRATEAVGGLIQKTKETVEGKPPEGSESGTHRPDSQETNQHNLRVYSGEDRTGQYILEGTLFGGSLGAIVCTALGSQDCTMLAAGAAAVGALGGYLTATREEKARLEAEDLQSDIDKANIALAEATVAIEAARQLTSQRRAELARLERDAVSQSSARNALRQELKDARGNLESMRKSSTRMGEQIVRIEADRAEEANRANRDEFDRIIRELKGQREELDSQIDILDGAVEDTIVL